MNMSYACRQQAVSMIQLNKVYLGPMSANRVQYRKCMYIIINTHFVLWTKSVLHRRQRYSTIMFRTARMSNRNAVGHTGTKIGCVASYSIDIQNLKEGYVHLVPSSSTSIAQHRSHAWFQSSRPGPARRFVRSAIAECSRLA